MSGPRTRTALAIALAIAVLLSGCMGVDLDVGLGPGGETTPTTTEPDPGAVPDPDLGTGGENPSSGPDADQVRADALSAIDGVETYRVDGRLVQGYRGVGNQTARVNTTTLVNRTDRSLYTNQSQSAAGRTWRVETYFVEGSLYSESSFYTQDYGSRWIVRRPANSSQAWSRLDVLARQRAVLSAANVSLVNTTTVDGTEAHLVHAALSGEEYDRLGGGSLAGTGIGAEASGVESVTVESVDFWFWVATDTHRPVKSTGSIDLVVSLADPAPNASRTVRVEQLVTLDYRGYGRTVNVTLPEGATERAVDVSSE